MNAHMAARAAKTPEFIHTPELVQYWMSLPRCSHAGEVLVGVDDPDEYVRYLDLYFAANDWEGRVWGWWGYPDDGYGYSGNINYNMTNQHPNQPEPNTARGQYANYDSPGGWYVIYCHEKDKWEVSTFHGPKQHEGPPCDGTALGTYATPYLALGRARQHERIWKQGVEAGINPPDPEWD